MSINIRRIDTTGTYPHVDAEINGLRIVFKNGVVTVDGRRQMNDPTQGDLEVSPRQLRALICGIKLAGHSVDVEEGVVYVDGHRQIDAVP